MSLQVPREPLLCTLFQLWESHPTKILIRDYSSARQQASVGQFLYDVLTTRERILSSLDPDVQDRLNDAETDVFVAVLVGPGYTFAVLAFALYSIGAVIVPLSPGLHPDEGRYFLQLCQAALLITVPTAQHQAQIVSTVASIIVDVTGSSKPEGAGFVLQPGGKTLINAEKGFVLLYTSGTTGPPKGVLHSRRAAEIGFVSNIKTLGLTPEDIWVHYSPVHWVGGFISMCHSILAGACVDFCSSVFSPDWLLERWEKKGQGEDGPTAMYLVPSLLESVGERLEAVRITGPLEKYELILRGLREMRVIYSGSTRVTPALRECWSNFRGGKPLMIVYGMSEAIGFVVTNDWQSNKDLPPDCCGRLRSNMELKISEQGELCVKSPTLFRRYLSEDSAVMSDVFDAGGYYRTGDLGKAEGDLIYVLGRASQDVIRFAGWRILAPEIESELTEHPFVSQAIIVGVQDSSVGERVAALLVVNNHSFVDSRLSLLALRKWLAVQKGMNTYKLPTILRLVGKDQELPTTPSGKIIKPKLRDLFFNQEELESDRVQVHDISAQEPEIGYRPFDWAGIQAK